jgi:hypothetical protein
VQERLDPIDWATYEPHLWANEAAVRPRTAVLFGSLTRLVQTVPQSVGRAAPSGGVLCCQAAPEAGAHASSPGLLQNRCTTGAWNMDWA